MLADPFLHFKERGGPTRENGDRLLGVSPGNGGELAKTLALQRSLLVTTSPAANGYELFSAFFDHSWRNS